MAEVRQSAEFVVDSSSRRRRVEIGKFLGGKLAAALVCGLHAPDVAHQRPAQSNQVARRHLLGKKVKCAILLLEFRRGAHLAS